MIKQYTNLRLLYIQTTEHAISAKIDRVCSMHAIEPKTDVMNWMKTSWERYITLWVSNDGLRPGAVTTSVMTYVWFGVNVFGGTSTTLVFSVVVAFQLSQVVDAARFWRTQHSPPSLYTSYVVVQIAII